MGAIQNSLLGVVGSAAGAALVASKLGEKFSSEKEAGVDAKMALKARKTAQQKIKTIQANKEISEKARTRRIGKVIDEYTKEMSRGGKK